MRGRGDVALLAAGSIVLVLLALASESTTPRADRTTYSTYDSGRSGYRAIYETLRGAGVSVRRFERQLALLDPDVRTLVISGYEDDPDAKPLSRGDADRLARFVNGGGRLVVLDDDFAGKLDVTPGVGSSHPIRARAAVALAHTRYTAGVERVGAPMESAFEFARWPGAVPLLANDAGVVAVAYGRGKGEVIAITAPALLDNADLLARDNLAFAYDSLAGHGPVAFDEYVHGYDRNATFWQVLPAPVRAAAWIVAAIVVLALIGANVPFAPPIPPESGDARDSAPFVEAMGALMRRTHAAGPLIAAFAADAARIARGRRTTPGMAAALSELERLSGASPRDADLLRAAVLDYRIRKDLS